MNTINRYVAASETGNQRFGLGLRDRPFSCMSGLVAALSVVGAAVYVVAFSDSSDDIWHHVWVSLPFVAALAGLFAAFYSLEKNGPLPLALRRGVWTLILVIYGCVCVLIIFFAISPYGPRGSAVDLLIRIPPTLPFPYFAWKWLRQSKVANQSPEPTPASGMSRAEHEPRLP